MERQAAQPDKSSVKPPAAGALRDDYPLERLLRQWRKLRQDLNRQLTAYLIEGLLETRTGMDPPRTKALCQSLMDYLFIGHFMVYPGLVLNAQGVSAEERRLAWRNYRKISASTDRALSFNDRYDFNGDCVGVLLEDVNRLNQDLLVRFVLEEQLAELLGSK